jgi:hypothetical protein
MQGAIFHQLTNPPIHLQIFFSEKIRSLAPGPVLPILEQFQERGNEQLAQLYMEDVTL